MKFSVSLSEFQKALQKTLPAMPPKSTLPILEHLNFNLAGDVLNVIATDQDITIMSTINVESGTDGSVLVPGRRLNEIAKALGHSGGIEFSTSEDTFEITLTTANGVYSMKGLNPDEYLDLPELFDSEKPNITGAGDAQSSDGNSAFFHKSDLMRLANKTAFAVSRDEFRPAMTGVLFQFRGAYVNAVATDSYRLSKAVVKDEKAQYPEELDIILPSRSVELLKKIDSDAVMSMIETQEKITHVRFDMGNTIFITKVIDEKFPPYETVIPDNNNLVVIVDKTQLSSALKRVAIFTSTISKQIRVSISGNQIVMKGEDEEGGTQAKETVPCDYDGEQLEIGFNYHYLEDALQNIDSELLDENKIYLTFSEPTKPVLVKPDLEGSELLMLIMPVRLV